MDLDGLLEERADLSDSGDFDRLRAIREKLIEHHEDSEHAVEAIYRVGLDKLFRERNFPGALEFFEQAAKRKHPYWSAAARPSMGICLYHQGRKQKAILELRKVGFVENPSEHSVASLAFIETIFLNEGEVEDVVRTRKERIKQLEKLIKAAREEGDKVQANGARALGSLAALLLQPAAGAQHREAAELQPRIVEALLRGASARAPKVAWNSCYALSHLLQVGGAELSQAAGGRIIDTLLQTLLFSPNFKVRLSAAAGLASPATAAVAPPPLEFMVGGEAFGDPDPASLRPVFLLLWPDFGHWLSAKPPLSVATAGSSFPDPK